ncbi:MAG TPA: bifunctional aspartate kinase/homoserine dehydrogenase I [Puia sp.]|jgi:aspartokinase/homoserine dehydrogenase 1|nr:bifunctional aspartate kinase/homoserine dehydrogenase I [Puia sp.]
MQVLKFGGSSVANAENISRVITLVLDALKKDRTILVVSALGGITDMLIHAASSAAAGDESYKEQLQEIEHRHLETVRTLLPITRQSAALSAVKTRCNEIEDICSGVFLLGELSPRTQDKIVSYGELLSSYIIAARFASLDIDHTWKDSRELIATDSRYGHAAVDFTKTNRTIREYIDSSSARLFVFPGFIAADDKGITTTLGRGGSDYTAAILAAAVDARTLDIWTDVSGMMTADPRLVTNVKLIPRISYQEAMELSHFGAKVIYPPTIQPVMRKNIPVRIKNTFSPEDAGTVIELDAIHNGDSIRGISSIPRIALLSLEGSGMVGIPGFSKRLFEALSSHQINVILITQGSSEHSICVGIDESNVVTAKNAIDHSFQPEIAAGTVDPLIVETGLSVIALVGDHMKSHPGISGKMFGVMGRNGVNVRAIAQGSSERNISAVIAAGDVKKAINVLHEEFFETSYRQLNLFITGTGNVGRRLIEQLRQQKDWLQQQLRIQLRLVGLANSRKMVFDNEGIDLHNWRDCLEAGSPMSLDKWIDGITTRNLRNSVFADVTANGEVAARYAGLLGKTISVVACNKIACSSPYKNYRHLKDLAREYNARFLFETNVGAGLPVIGTLNDLLRSGDKIHRIEAVLSGTLNFVFNHYNGSRPFADVVRQAQTEGYTEPDPRLDLSGTDVMRKIMILAREAGEHIEMEDIANHSFLPASCMQGSVEDFYAEMAKEEQHFQQLYQAAATKGKKLKFVAQYDNGKASVGLQHIGPEQDLYHLYGKDNVVLFYTDRYSEQPLVVKGAGAGAEVTASGVFADILRIINS